MKPEQMHFASTRSIVMRDGCVLTQRLITEHDTEAMADFYASVPRDDSRFYMRPSMLNAERAQADTAECNHPNVVAIVLENDQNQIVGFSWYRWENAQSPTSTFGICIRRGYQGIGAGEAQLKRILEITKHVGPDVMCLTVQKANTRAQRLYTKCGFQIVREQMIGERDGFDAEPEYYMEQRIR